MRFGTRGESRHLFMPHMDPFNLALAPKRVGQPVQTIADNAVNSFDAGRGKGFGELIGDGLHDRAPFGRRVSASFALREVLGWPFQKTEELAVLVIANA